MIFGRKAIRVSEPQGKRRRASAFTRVFRSLVAIGFILALAGGALLFYGHQEFTMPGPLAETKTFQIERGLTTAQIASELQRQQIIDNPSVFTTAALITGARGRLRAGEYEFPASISMRDVMNLLLSGKVITYKLSIPEGWTSEMALARIAENPVLTGDMPPVPAEGAILPDTYVFERGKTRQSLVEDMVEAQNELLAKLWAARNPDIPLKSPEEAVVLASIVEKETGVAAERPVIASVFFNRLDKGMRLQSDPTIIYGLVGGKGKLDRSLTRADITSPTAYNTYVIKGLPPGPIANPGKAALEAVLNPAETSYLYFVADGTGGHAFAASLEEHNKNVARWRNIEGNAANSAAAEDEAKAEEPETEAPKAEAPSTAQPALPEIDTLKPEEQPGATGEEPSVPSDTVTAAAPAATPAEPAKPEAQAPEAALEPGSVITVDEVLIPIPKLKPKR